MITTLRSTVWAKSLLLRRITLRSIRNWAWVCCIKCWSAQQSCLGITSFLFWLNFVTSKNRSELDMTRYESIWLLGMRWTCQERTSCGLWRVGAVFPCHPRHRERSPRLEERKKKKKKSDKHTKEKEGLMKNHEYVHLLTTLSNEDNWSQGPEHWQNEDLITVSGRAF